MFFRLSSSAAETVFPAAVFCIAIISFFLGFLEVDVVDLIQIPALLVHMQKFVIICSQELCDIGPQVFSGTDHKGIAFFRDSGNSFQFSQVSQEPVVTGLRFDFQCIIAFRRNLASQFASYRNAINSKLEDLNELIDELNAKKE